MYIYFCIKRRVGLNRADSPSGEFVYTVQVANGDWSHFNIRSSNVTEKRGARVTFRQDCVRFPVTSLAVKRAPIRRFILHKSHLTPTEFCTVLILCVSWFAFPYQKFFLFSTTNPEAFFFYHWDIIERQNIKGFSKSEPAHFSPISKTNYT